MPRIKKETRLAIDAMDMLFHIMVRSVNENSVDHLSLFIDIREDVDSMVEESKYDEYHKTLLEFYSICFFQLKVMASLPSSLTEFKLNNLSVKNSDFNASDFKKVEKFESDFVFLNAKTTLESEALRKGVDVEKAYLISSNLYDNYQNNLSDRPSVFLIDLPIKVMLFRDPFCFPKLLAFFSKHKFFNCERVNKNSDKTSFMPLLVLALYREFNQAIASGISFLYKKKTQNLKEMTVVIEGEEVDSSLLEIRFNTQEIKYSVFKKVVKQIIGEEDNSSYEEKKCPLDTRPPSDSDIVNIIEYAVEGLCFRIFFKEGRQYRIDKIVSMIGGYYLYLGLCFLDQLDGLPVIHNSITGRFQKLDENKSSSSYISGIMKKFGISVSPNVIYREYLSGKKSLYADAPYRWVLMINGKNNIYGFGPFLSQVVSGSFEYMQE